MRRSLIFFLLLCATVQAQLVDVFSEGEGGYFCFKIPALIASQSGDLLAFAEARKFNCADHTWIDLVMKRSKDSGATWSALQIVYSNSSDTYGNITIGNAAPVLQTYSDDDGITWSAPVPIADGVQPGWHWIGTGPPGSIQLPTGRIVVPAYHGPFSWDDGEWTRSHVMYSDDGGATWTVGATMGTLHRTNECQAALLADGSIYINARTLGQRRVAALSLDGGETFAKTFEIAGLEEPFEGCEGSTIRAPNSTSLVYSGLHTDILYRYNLSMHVSTDNGISFEPVRVIDSGPSGYSTLAVLLGGQAIGMLYERSNVTAVVFVPQHISFTVGLTADDIARFERLRGARH